MLFLGYRYLLCQFLQAEISGGKRLSGAHTCFQNRLVHPVLATEPGTSIAKQTSLWTHFFWWILQDSRLAAEATNESSSLAGSVNCSLKPPGGHFHVHTMYSHPSGRAKVALKEPPKGWLVASFIHRGTPTFLGSRKRAVLRLVQTQHLS